MAISINVIAYGAVFVAGVILFSIGTPDERAPRMALAAAVPATEPRQTAPAPSVVAGGGVTLHSVGIDLPDSGKMFPGPGSDAINNNCLACHSAGMVLNQPVLSKSAWQTEVTKMIQFYKAPVSEGDVPAIVDYLARMKAAD
jgi:cytochrome c5